MDWRRFCKGCSSSRSVGVCDGRLKDVVVGCTHPMWLVFLTVRRVSWFVGILENHRDRVCGLFGGGMCAPPCVVCYFIRVGCVLVLGWSDIGVIGVLWVNFRLVKHVFGWIGGLCVCHGACFNCKLLWLGWLFLAGFNVDMP